MVRIEEYTARRQADVTALADRVLGKGFFSNPAQTLGAPLAQVFVGLTKRDETVGFATARLLPPGGLRDFIENRLELIPEDLETADAAGALGAIETVVVAPEHRGRGVGTKLLRVVHDAVVGHGGDKLIVTFKRGPGDSPVDAMMARLGFAPWVKFASYWAERCEQGDFVCVHRKTRCSCEAIFYRKAIY